MESSIENDNTWTKPDVLLKEAIVDGYVSIEKDQHGSYLRISKMIGTKRDASGKIMMKTYKGVEYPQQRWANIRITLGDIASLKKMITDFEQMQ